eukprot:6312441-Amphidinium_carterae.2
MAPAALCINLYNIQKHGSPFSAHAWKGPLALTHPAGALLSEEESRTRLSPLLSVKGLRAS